MRAYKSPYDKHMIHVFLGCDGGNLEREIRCCFCISAFVSTPEEEGKEYSRYDTRKRSIGCGGVL